MDTNKVIDIKEILSKKPAKGILKTSSSFETSEASQCRKSHADKAAKFDEMNIIATLHPADKDYGHMTVNEPKTPFEREVPDEDEMDTGVDPDVLSDMIKTNLETDATPKIHLRKSSTDESEGEEDETPEQRAARKSFEMKRKAHYNEFFAAKLARQLLDDEDEENEDKKDETSEDKPEDEKSSEDKNSNEDDNEEHMSWDEEMEQT